MAVSGPWQCRAQACLGTGDIFPFLRIMSCFLQGSVKFFLSYGHWVCPTPVWPHPNYIFKDPLCRQGHRVRLSLCYKRTQVSLWLVQRKNPHAPCWKIQLPFLSLSRCNTVPREGMNPGPHQTRMCHTVRPRILIPLPSSFWNPKLWSTPALPMPA